MKAEIREIDGKATLFVDGTVKYMRDFTKAYNSLYWFNYSDEQKIEFTNPFSGVTEVLSGIEASICGFILKVAYIDYERSAPIIPVKTFDTMRNLFRQLNVGAYYNLID